MSGEGAGPPPPAPGRPAEAELGRPPRTSSGLPGQVLKRKGSASAPARLVPRRRSPGPSRQVHFSGRGFVSEGGGSSGVRERGAPEVLDEIVLSQSLSVCTK